MKQKLIGHLKISANFESYLIQNAFCIDELATENKQELEKGVYTRAGTLQSINRRLIGCLISFTRSAEFNRSRLLDLLEKPKSKSF